MSAQELEEHITMRMGGVIIPTAPTQDIEKRNFCLQIHAFKVLGAILGPRWAQDPLKTFQDPSRAPPRPILGPKFMDFGAPTGWIWGRFVVDLGVYVYQLRMIFGIKTSYE